MLKNNLLQIKKSFTLIETIVVIAVIGITLPVLFAIIFTLMRQQVKIYRLSQVKREGDYLIGIIENTIRDRAVTVHNSAPSNDLNIVCKDKSYPIGFLVSSLYFLDKNKQWFGYEYDGLSKISFKAADLQNPPNVLTFDLTSSKILITNFSISCLRNTLYSSPSVLFDFDICYDTGTGVCTSTRPEEVSSIHYQTIIKLRNY